MTRIWGDETTELSQSAWYREDKPTLAEQALQARIRRDRAVKVAGWLWAAVAGVVLVLLIAATLYAFHMGGPLTGGK